MFYVSPPKAVQLLRIQWADGKITEMFVSFVCRIYEGIVERSSKRTTKLAVEKNNSEVDKALCPSWKAGYECQDVAPEQVFRKR